MKPKLVIPVVLFLCFIHSVGWTKENDNNFTEVTPWYVLNYFPICQITSSLGQKCKYLPQDEKIWSSPRHIDGVKKVFMDDEKLDLETSDWIYSFKIEKLSENLYNVIFLDKGKYTTYHTETIFHVSHKFKPDRIHPRLKIEETIIFGETLNYISGNSEDKSQIGKRQSGVNGLSGKRTLIQFLPKNFRYDQTYYKNPISYKLDIEQVSFCKSPDSKNLVIKDNLVERGGRFYRKFDTEPFTGTIEVFDGDYFERGSYKCGLKDGEHTTFYKNGQLIRSKNFVFGLEHGKSVLFNSNGTPSSELNYFEGKITNTILKSFDGDGRLVMETPFKLGKWNGEKKFFLFCKLTEQNIHYLSNFYEFDEKIGERLGVEPNTDVQITREYLTKNRCYP